MTKNTVLPIALQAITASTLLNTYLEITSADLTGAPFILYIHNTSDENVVISFDGIIDHAIVLSQSMLDIPCQAGSAPNNNVAKFSRSTRVWARAENAIPTLGSVTVSGFYQPNIN